MIERLHVHRDPPLDFAGRHAVVTGATGPIGREITRRLAHQGSHVTVIGRREQELRTVPGAAAVRVCDLTDPIAVASTVREVPPTDLLVCCAGGGGRPVPLAELTAGDWREIIDINLTTTFLTLQAFVAGMVTRQAGAIVVMNSDAAVTLGPASIPYAAAKAAVLSLTRSVAAETARHGVRVNSIAPGTVRTAEIDALPLTVTDRLDASHPSGRMGTTTDVADLALFLLSDRATWLTGQLIIPGARDLH